MRLTKPFLKFSTYDIARPLLPVTIINPYCNRKVRVICLIDTGADECSLPAFYAAILGHKLNSGNTKEIITGNGITRAYSHTVRIKTGDFMTDNVLIDFMPNLNIPLLGTKSFLSKFILTINYPEKYFSLYKDN